MSENTELLTVKAVYEEYVHSLREKDGEENERGEDGPKKESSNQVWHFVYKYLGKDRKGKERKMSDLKGREVEEYVKKFYVGPQSAEHMQAVKDFLKYADKQNLTGTDLKDKHTLANHLRIPRPKSQAKSIQARDGQATDVIELTPQGHQNLVAELEELKAQRGPIAEQIRRAAADKDVRENAPLEAAREHQGQVEARIREIENTLEIGEIVDPSAHKKAVVQMGSRVLLKDLESKREIQYTIVSALEAKPLEGKMSDKSPVGKAVINRREGDPPVEVKVSTPQGGEKKTTYKILKVW